MVVGQAFWKQVVTFIKVVHGRDMASVNELIDHVMDLPRTDRSYLAKKLLESLDLDDGLTVAERQLVSRRSSEMNDGVVKPLNLQQLRDEVGRRLS